MKFKIKNIYFLIIFLFILLGIFLYLISLGGALAWDEVVYLANARGKISHSNFTEDFRFPLLSTFIAGIWFVIGESVLSAQLFIVLVSLISIILFYLISLHFFSEKLALFSSIIFGLTLQFITWGFRVYTDMLGVCLFLASFLFLLKFDKYNKEPKKIPISKSFEFVKNKKYLVLMAGIFSGLSFTARYSTVIVSAILGCYFLLKKDYIKRSLIFSGGFILSIIPWFIHGYITQGNPLYFVLSQTSAIMEYTMWESPIIFFKLLSTEFNIALIFILFNILYFTNKIKKPKFLTKDYLNKILLIFSILFFQLLFYLFYIRLKLARYILELSPFLILLIVFGLQAIILIRNFKYKKLLIGISIILIFLSVIVPTTIGFIHLRNTAICTNDGALHLSIDYLDARIKPGKTIVSGMWPYYGYYLNSRVFSTWTDDIGLLINETDPDYFAMSEGIGLSFEGNITHDRVSKLKSFEDSCGWKITIYKVE